MRQYKQVVFDFGGVLVEWAPKYIAKLHSDDAAIQQRVLHEVIQHPDWLELDRGSYTEVEMAKRIAARSDFNEDEVRSVFDTVRLSFTPLKEGVMALKSLIEKGVPCYGLSNMSVENYKYLYETHDFFGLLQGEIISGKEKLIKPDAAIYERLCERFNLIPQETLFIDDMWKNCQAAEYAGFQTFHFERGLKDIPILIER